METENSNQSPAAATEEAAATKNGGNATQEVSSTTQPAEPTKRSLRVETWTKLRDNKYSARFVAIFNRIPGFVGNDLAAVQLSGTDEFKKANDIKVLLDRPLHAAKFQVLLAGKNLYLPRARDSKALFLKVDVPTEATDEQKSEILSLHNIEKRIEIPLENKVELDMIVIGSVVVSRDGYRIGRGNGFNDLDIGLLREVGAITDKTVIATMVHDAQVVDSLPTNLFKKYDAPVDLIVTPTTVIRVEKRLPRPDGVFWDILSERRLKMVPILQELKEIQEKAGKVIVLKEEDTDIEQKRESPFHFHARRQIIRRPRRRTTSQNNAGKQDGENQKLPTHRRRYYNRPNRRRPTKSELDQKLTESKSQDRKSVAGGGNNGKPRMRRPRMMRDFSVRVTNITRDVRIRDLKSELRSRQCNPIGITWKGQYGRCYLHFGHRGAQPNTEEDISKVLEALKNLSLTITKTQPKKKDVPAATNGEGDSTASNNAAGDAIASNNAAGDDTTAGDATASNATAGDSTTGDATTDDAATGDATTGDATTGDATTGDAIATAGDATTGDATAGDGEQKTEKTEADSTYTKTINLKVELVRRNVKKVVKKSTEAETGETADDMNGGEDPATGGDASSARIESVDTTTV